MHLSEIKERKDLMGEMAVEEEEEEVVVAAVVVEVVVAMAV